MNRKQRRIQQAQSKITLRGRSHMIEEAAAFAMQEQGLGNLQAAIDIYNAIIAEVPSSAEAYNNRGVLLQEMKRHDDALASYDKAIALKPDYGEAHYNRGVTLQEMKWYDYAVASYDKAIALNPKLTEAYNNRGNILLKLRQYDDALASYDKAIALKPNLAEVYFNRGLALQKLHRYVGALASYDKAITLKPDYANAYNNRSNTLQRMKLYDDALTSCDKAIAFDPSHAEAHQSRGVILVNKGDMQEAEKMFLQALALRPNFPEALFSLTSLRKYHDADHPDAKSIQALLDKFDNALDDREYLYFSLGKIYDDCGLWDKAFECYQQANYLRNAIVLYDSGKIAQMTGNIMDVFTSEFFAEPPTFAPGSQSPIFIVGMPRSGTTLMASILSNHPRIATAGELETIDELALSLPKLAGIASSYPQAMKHITPAIATQLTGIYEKRLRRDTGSDILHVVDKHPLNFRHLGFIATLFPKARIIHCTRHPLDTSLSNYFQRFTLYYDYAFDLHNIAHFYGEYTKLMKHWQSVLPAQIIEVSYEDMVTNTEAVARKTLGLLGLEWNERCLTPHTNPSPIETASQWQVRQPIYQQSVGRWRNYEKYLAPLKEIFQRTG